MQAPARVRMDPSGDVRPRDEAVGARQHRPNRSRLFRAILPLIFVGLVLGVIFGVKMFLQADRSPVVAKGVEPADAVEPILPADSFEVLTSDGTENLPVGDVNMPVIGGDQPPQTPSSPPIDSGIAALNLLESFLKMKTLEERLPFIETQREDEVLTNSILNGQLPEVLKTTVDVIVREPSSFEQVADHYYHVEFASEGGEVNPQTMLVRTRGTQPPKVVVDPFLDLFGGRFAKFASEPIKEAGTFQVIISAGGGCYADIPDADKKLTMKILAHENGNEIARAYFGRQSQIGRMLEDETSGLGYGQVKPCTVLMRWNMDDDPERPVS